MKPTRERGRPARTIPGTAWSSPPLGSNGNGAGESVFFVNMDIQDNQDETLLHRKWAPSMIRGACEVIPMGLGANSRILVEDKAMP